MNLCSKSFIKNLLKEKYVRPSKKLGQNFLISRNILKKIVTAANIEKTDVILEIGPGIGTLTYELAKKAKKVIAIEKDRKMVEILKETLKDFSNVEIIEGDILKTNSKQQTANNKKKKLLAVNCWLLADYKIVANLPYCITSPVIRKFLESKNPPKQMTLMVQKEVAQRIMAKPPHMNLLAVSVQFYAKPKIISYVSKKSFWPEPKVNSAIVQFTVNSKQPTINMGIFFKTVRAGFAHPRKQLVNNLSNKACSNFAQGIELKKENTAEWLKQNKINPEQRAQTLTLKDWINLTKSLK